MTNSGFKLTLGTIIGIVMIVFLINSCERIDAGHVGVKVNLYGTGKGVDDITECTGIVFYNPISTKIYEFPTYMQHKEYVKKEDSDNSFVINSKDGSEFHVSPIINYSVQRDKVPFIFNKYRRTLESIEEGFLKTTIYDAFRMTANIYTAEELISVIKNPAPAVSIGTMDHPEFACLREQLEQDGYIQVQRGWWNGDRVLKSFQLNDVKFKKGDQFPCAAAMSGHLKFRKLYKQKKGGHDA